MKWCDRLEAVREPKIFHRFRNLRMVELSYARLANAVRFLLLGDEGYHRFLNGAFDAIQKLVVLVGSWAVQAGR